MGITAQKQVACPPGQHTGVVLVCMETENDFNDGKGPVPVVEIVLAPDYRDKAGTRAIPLRVSYTPILNGLSALSQLLHRLGKHPADGEEWVPTSLNGTRVAFAVKTGKNGFANVEKDSITAAPK